jgi:YidC/Oxa1 family membrane protein insertase
VNLWHELYTGTDASTYIFALFQFFPSAISLRDSFFGQMIYLHLTPSMSCRFMFRLWNHISLFPILASKAILTYVTINQMAAPTQEADMAKMMKIMIYVSPLMMLFSLSSYWLSLHYSISIIPTIDRAH